MKLSLLFFSVLSVPSCSALAFSAKSTRTSPKSIDTGNMADDTRRRILSGALVAASAAMMPGAALADVSDGNKLPQGAAQFSRVLNIKADLKAVTKRVAEHGSEIDEKEWDNIGGFLRKLYSAGDDMKGISSGLIPDKKKAAEANIKLVQQYAKAGEPFVNKQDPTGFLAILKKESELVNDFFDYLSDVPDEI